MTRIKIKELVFDEWNIEHIKKHSLSVDEVKIAAGNMVTHKRAKRGRYIAIGRSGKRIVSIVINRVKTGVYYVVTARDSDKRERRILYEKEKKQNS